MEQLQPPGEGVGAISRSTVLVCEDSELLDHAPCRGRPLRWLSVGNYEGLRLYAYIYVHSTDISLQSLFYCSGQWGLKSLKYTHNPKLWQAVPSLYRIRCVQEI